MRVLVTGAEGFVGRRLVDVLQERGLSVLGSVRMPVVSSRPGVEILNLGDLRSSPQWGRALRGVDAVIHLAARAHVVDDQSKSPIAEFREVNVRPTVSLFQACQIAAVSRFVFVSSIGVNGVSTRGKPFSELDEPNPSEAYGQSKWEAEQALKELQKSGPTDVVIVRPALIYGPRARGNFLRLMHWIDRGRLIPVGSPSVTRSFLSLTHFCDLLARCITNVNAGNRLFLAADPEPISLLALVQTIAHLMNRPAKSVRISLPVLRLLGFLTGRNGEVSRLTASLVVDSSKARAILEWSRAGNSADDMQAMVDEYLRTENIGS